MGGGHWQPLACRKGSARVPCQSGAQREKGTTRVQGPEEQLRGEAKATAKLRQTGHGTGEKTLGDPGQARRGEWESSG